MSSRHRFTSFKALFTCTLIFISVSWIGGGDVAHAGMGYFPWPIAGTYLSVEQDGANIMQISADGNMSFITSDQFAGLGGLGESYSDTLGSWKWTGTRKITAELLDIGFDKDDGTFVGVAAYTAFIKFSRDLKTANLTCKGAVFGPGVDPFGPGAEPITGSEFTCGEMKFQRVGVQEHHNY